jgi:aminoglycoside phosphotransferase (APT) family kinase protein
VRDLAPDGGPLTTTVNEPLDIERHDTLLAYLRAAGHIASRESPTFTTLPGGVSSRTVLVERADGPDWVIKQSLPKLRVDVDWYSNPDRIHREALGMRWLTELAPPSSLPALVFEDHEQHLLAMDAVPRSHCNWKTALLAGALEIDHVRQFGRLLGTIHRRASERRTEIAEVFDDRSFFESLRIEPYYGYTGSQVAGSAPFMADLIESVRARRFTLVHGDYSPKNVLVHGGRLVLLDHEVIHFGDPAFDLGFSLAHLLSKAHHVKAQREEFTAAAEIYWGAYRESLGDPEWARDLEAHAIRNTLGCLLARVAGRSPLEYLSCTERLRQRDVVLVLMRETPLAIRDFVWGFSRGL